MKKSILSAVIFVALTWLASCEKSNSECNLVAAKIIRYDCDRVIFQLLTPGNFGDSNWLDVKTGIRYNNVASYYNTCKIAALTNESIDTLYVKVKSTYDASILTNCVQCLAASQDPPQTIVDFVEISKFPCKPSNTEQ